MIHRNFRYRLYPTAEQERQFEQFSGVCRFVYNLGLEQRRDWHRQHIRVTGRPITFASQCRELTALRASVDWIAEVPRASQEQALSDLDRAFVDFRSRRSGFPSPRAKGVHDTFRVKGIDTRIVGSGPKWATVIVPKIGPVKFRLTRPVRGGIKSATIRRAPNGWHVTITCEIEHEAPSNNLPAVGIDRGVATTLALSTGEKFSVPASLGEIERRKRRAQKILSRRKRGSRRYAKQRQRVARMAARMGRVRSDWQHRTSTDIARRFGAVILEDLNTKGMTSAAGGKGRAAKAGLNRSILNQGWYGFEVKLAYKLEERGGTLVKVNPAYTSQTCAECGVIDARSRESQAVFCCVACGHEDHADTNAARNILRRNTASMLVEGARLAPAEARTTQVAA